MMHALTSSDVNSGWAGSIAFGADWLLYNGVVGPTERHAHHADQIVVSASTDTVELEVDGHVISGQCIAIRSDLPHSVRQGALLVDVLFVEPSGRAASSAVPPGGLARPRPVTSWNEARERAADIRDVAGLSAQSRETSERPNHPEAVAALSALPDLVADGPVSTRDLAELVGLSPSRLSHVFVEQTGIPDRSYVRWGRLTIAAERLCSGDTITAAAHAAGFSDGAHLSRTFRSMFGLSPSDVFAHARFLLPS